MGVARCGTVLDLWELLTCGGQFRGNWGVLLHKQWNGGARGHLGLRTVRIAGMDMFAGARRAGRAERGEWDWGVVQSGLSVTEGAFGTCLSRHVHEARSGLWCSGKSGKHAWRERWDHQMGAFECSKIWPLLAVATPMADLTRIKGQPRYGRPRLMNVSEEMLWRPSQIGPVRTSRGHRGGPIPSWSVSVPHCAAQRCKVLLGRFYTLFQSSHRCLV